VTANTTSIIIAVIGLLGSAFAIFKERTKEKSELSMRQLELTLQTQAAQIDRQDARDQAKDAKIEAQNARIDSLRTEVHNLTDQVRKCESEREDQARQIQYLRNEVARLRDDGTGAGTRP